MDKFIGSYFKRKNESEGSEQSKRACGEIRDVCASQETQISSANRLQDSSQEDVITDEKDLPICWTKEQWINFKGKYEWLFCKSGGLGCLVCAEVQSLGANANNQGVHLSSEWAKGLIRVKEGGEKHTQQKQLRKKIYEHRDTKSHKTAESILISKKKKPIENIIEENFSLTQEVTSRVFRTAYHIAKHNRPFTDHPKLIDLQTLNGIDMGRTLHSNVTCSEIMSHIAKLMKQKIVDSIIHNRTKISLLVDESTSISNQSVLIVYLQGAINNGDITTIFLDLVNLNSTKAIEIKNSLMRSLEKYGLKTEILKEILVGLCTDGASVMLGKRAGLATLLKQDFPNILTWHCMNHRLELAVHDALNEVTVTNHFSSFLDKLYSVFSMSPKNQRELNECAEQLCSCLTKIGKMISVRWVASSYRAVTSIWKNYDSLHTFFTNAAHDSDRDYKERSTFEGLANKLHEITFVKNLGLMMDALSELSSLSESLQEKQITLPRANRLLQRTIEVLKVHKERGGIYWREVEQAMKEHQFRGIPLKACEKRKNFTEINRGQIYQSIITNLAKRCMTEKDKRYSDMMKILYPDYWPEDIDVDYGEEDLKEICNLFCLRFNEMKQAYRDFKDSGGKHIPATLVKLLKCIQTIPISNAECERGFSVMNNIVTPTRNSLCVERVSSLLTINSCGPPVAQWNPLPYVKSWMAKGRNSALAHCKKRQDDCKTNTSKDAVWKLL
jgi:hypothetical protein